MKSFIIILSICMFLSSCDKDDSLDPRPDLVAGQFVSLNIITGRIDANNLVNAGFEGILDAPGKNVDKYELYVAKRNSFGFVTDYVLLQTISSFPSGIKVTSADVQAKGIPALQLADQLRFYGKSYKDGVVADFNSLSGTLKSSQGQKQAYKFYTDVTNTPDVKLDNQYTW